MTQPQTKAPDLPPQEKFNHLASIFGARKVARMVHTKTAHLTRFAVGEATLGPRRRARLDTLYEVVHDLEGSYNTLGISQWFNRPRTTLGHQSPRYVFEAAPWSDRDRSVRHVRKLAKDATASPAT